MNDLWKRKERTAKREAERFSRISPSLTELAEALGTDVIVDSTIDISSPTEFMQSSVFKKKNERPQVIISSELSTKEEKDYFTAYGLGLVRERELDADEQYFFFVSDERPRVIHQFFAETFAGKFLMGSKSNFSGNSTLTG